MAVIAAATTLPVPRLPVPASGFPVDKLAHLALYLGLGLVLGRALWVVRGAFDRSLAVALVAGLLFAALDELHQRWIPFREPELADWLADAAGLSLGLALYVWARLDEWRKASRERGR